MTRPYKRPESVLVVLYNEKLEVLVLQREDDASFWQSVTGSMEEGEVPVQTALREVEEETGICLQAPSNTPIAANCLIDCRKVNQYSIRKDWRVRYAPGVDKNFEYVFCAQVASQSEIRLSEHLQYLWLKKTQAIEKVWSTSNKQAIAQFVPN